MASRARKVEQPPLNGDVFPASAGPTLQLVALDAIELPEQVRTHFDEASLAELAADVKANGILQAVLLRPIGDGRYRFIAGERRIRAARIAGFSAVPALVGDVSDEQAEDMQLAENIQREDLSLQDEARAVRKLYDRLGKVERVAQRVHKSAAWVSKRLALTYDGFDTRARRLLEDGVTEDVELLQCVAKIGALDLQAACEIDHDIRAGKAGRKEARAMLSRLKKEATAQAKAGSPPAKEEGGTDGEGSGPVFDARAAMWQLAVDARSGALPPVAEVVASLSGEQQQAVLNICRDDFEQGAARQGQDGLSILRGLARLQGVEQLEEWTIPVFTMGAFGMKFELGVLLSELSLAVADA